MEAWLARADSLASQLARTIFFAWTRDLYPTQGPKRQGNECVSWSRKDDTRHDVTGQTYDTNHGVLHKLPVSH